MNKFHKTNGKNELKGLHKFISESKTDRMIRAARKKEGTWTPLDEKNYNQRKEDRKQRSSQMPKIWGNLENNKDLSKLLQTEMEKVFQE